LAREAGVAYVALQNEPLEGGAAARSTMEIF